MKSTIPIFMSMTMAVQADDLVGRNLFSDLQNEMLDVEWKKINCHWFDSAENECYMFDLKKYPSQCVNCTWPR